MENRVTFYSEESNFRLIIGKQMVRVRKGKPKVLLLRNEDLAKAKALDPEGKEMTVQISVEKFESPRPVKKKGK